MPGNSQYLEWEFEKLKKKAENFVSGEVNPVTGGISVFDLVVVYGLVADDSTCASANTDKIQNALDSGGRVFVGKSGVVYINGPLIIGSDTALVLSPKTEIKNADGTNNNVLNNKAYASVPFSTVTVSWSSGTLMTVNWVAHKLSSGDFAVIKSQAGTSDSAYSGVFEVVSVLEDSFVVQLRRIPSASPSGTYSAKKADRNISVEGGVFDWNNSGNYLAGQDPKMHAIVLSGVSGLRVSKVQARRAEKYILCVGAVRDFVIDGIASISHGSDIVKVYGPAFDGRVLNVSGNCGDDPVSLQPQEPSEYAAFDITGWGDVLNVQVDGVSVAGSNGATLGSVAVYTSPNQLMDGIEINRVSVKGPGGVRVATIFASNGKIKRIKFSGIERAADNANDLISFVKTDIESVEISGVQGQAGINLVGGGTSVQVYSGTIRSLSISKSNTNIGANYKTFYMSGGTIEHLVLDGNRMWSLGGSTGSLADIVVGTVSKITAVNNNLHNLANAVQFAGSGTPSISIVGNELDAMRDGVRVTAAANIYAADNAVTNGGLSLGLVAISGSIAVSVESGGGNTGVSAGSFIGYTGSPTVTVRGFDIKTDLSKVARTDGSYCYNTNSALGTLASAGLVSCQGSSANSWRLLGDPTKQY